MWDSRVKQCFSVVKFNFNLHENNNIFKSANNVARSVSVTIDICIIINLLGDFAKYRNTLPSCDSSFPSYYETRWPMPISCFTSASWEFRKQSLSTVQCSSSWVINHSTPNGHYMGRTAQLTSRCCILYIYSTNILTEYFKHAA